MRLPNGLGVLIVTGGLLLPVACVESPQAEPQRPEGGAAQGQEAAGDPDKFFLVQAALMNLAEVEIGRVAAERAASSEVKEFARKMVEEHTQANRELADLARKKGLELPGKAGDMPARVAAHLSKLQGQILEQEYLALMTAVHAMAVSLFESKVRLARDPDIRAWAERTLPVLREHWRVARDLSGKIAGTGER